MTKEEIMRIALEQSAIDANGRPEDFISGQNRTDVYKRQLLMLAAAATALIIRKQHKNKTDRPQK